MSSKYLPHSIIYGQSPQWRWPISHDVVDDCLIDLKTAFDVAYVKWRLTQPHQARAMKGKDVLSKHRLDEAPLSTQKKGLANALRLTCNFNSSSRTHAIRRLLRWSTHTKAEPRSRTRIVENCFFTIWSNRPAKHKAVLDIGSSRTFSRVTLSTSMAEPAIALRIHLQSSLTSFRDWTCWWDTVNERRLRSLGCRAGCFICCSSKWESAANSKREPELGIRAQ